MRRAVGWAALLAAVALATAGLVVAEARVNTMIEARVASGVPVEAEVTDVNFLGTRRSYRSVDIRYAYAGRSYRGTIGWTHPDSTGRPREGARIEVFVDPAAPRRAATRDGGASEGPFLLLPVLGFALALLAIGAVAQVRIDGLGRVSRRALSRSPAGGTVYRATRFLLPLPVVVVVFSVATGAALAPHPAGLAIALIGAGAALWWLHTVVFGTNVVVADGRMTLHAASQRVVVPLGEVTAITHRAALGTLVQTRAGAAIPVAAAMQRDPADAERQARRIVALADAQARRPTGPVVTTRNWRYLAIQALTLGAVATGLALLLLG